MAIVLLWTGHIPGVQPMVTEVAGDMVCVILLYRFPHYSVSAHLTVFHDTVPNPNCIPSTYRTNS